MICFMRVCDEALCKSAIADWLFIRKVVGPSHGYPIFAKNERSHIACFAACVAAKYSASVLESTTEGCFFEKQLMATPARVKT